MTRALLLSLLIQILLPAAVAARSLSPANNRLTNPEFSPPHPTLMGAYLNRPPETGPVRISLAATPAFSHAGIRQQAPAAALWDRSRREKSGMVLLIVGASCFLAGSIMYLAGHSSLNRGSSTLEQDLGNLLLMILGAIIGIVGIVLSAVGGAIWGAENSRRNRY